MEQENLHIEELIARKLSGEITPAEEAVLQAWLEQSEENRTYFRQLEFIYMESPGAERAFPVNTDAAWEKIKPGSERKEGKIRSLSFGKWARIAAILFLIAGAGAVFYVYSTMNGGTEYRYAALNEASLFTLPDSSTVYLNKNSSVIVVFSDKKRSVELQGEGYFTVKHNEQLPFEVHTGALTIRDIGTAFNINARTNDSISVNVTDGEVEMTAADQKVNLIKGQRSVYMAGERSFKPVTAFDPNEISYSTKIFVFENTSLPAAIEKLREVYAEDVTLDDNLRFCRITSTFKNEKLESILQVIAETLHLKLEKTGNKYRLSGDSCTE